MAAFAVLFFLFSLNASANRQVCDFQGTPEQAWEILVSENKVDPSNLQAKEEFLKKIQDRENLLVVYETPDGKHELRHGSPAELGYDPMVEAKGDCPTVDELKAKAPKEQPPAEPPREENLPPQEPVKTQEQKTPEPTISPTVPGTTKKIDPESIPLSFGEQRGLKTKKPAPGQVLLAQIPKNYSPTPPVNLEPPPDLALETPASQEAGSLARPVSPSRAQRHLYPDVEIDPTPIDPVRNINSNLADNALRNLVGTVASCLAGANFKETPYMKTFYRDPFSILFCMVRTRF